MKWLPVLDSFTHDTKSYMARVFRPVEGRELRSKFFVSKQALLTDPNKVTLRYGMTRVVTDLFESALATEPEGDVVTYLVTLTRRDERRDELFVDGVRIEGSLIRVYEESGL